MSGRRYACLFALALLAGCEESSVPPTAPAPPRQDSASRYDPATTGTISGRVVWNGPRPVVAPFRSIDYPLTDNPNPPPPREWPNPNAPALAPNGGVGSAVVYLRGVEPTRGRPWDHAPVRVELRDHSFRPTGRFVRAGDEVELVSRQPFLHTVQLRGADFCALTLPQPDAPRKRRLDKPGVVELLSGVGLYWMRAYLFVDHHPYYAATDAQGRFTLRDVPEGDYDLVGWHADWRVVREERNHESFRVQQVRFGPAIESARKVRVSAGQTSDLDLPLSVK